MSSGSCPMLRKTGMVDFRVTLMDSASLSPRTFKAVVRSAVPSAWEGVGWGRREGVGWDRREGVGWGR